MRITWCSSSGVTSTSIVVRNRSGEALDVEVANLKIENAAAGLDADRRSDDVHRNRDFDLLVHEDANEINVLHPARDRIDLQVFDHRVTLLIRTCHFQKKHRADAVLALQNEFGNGLLVDENRDRVTMAAVNDRRYFSISAEFLRDALAGTVATGNFQNEFSHDETTPLNDCNSKH